MFERTLAYVRKENNGFVFKYEGEEHESFVSDNAEGNTDFHNIQKWISNGGVPEVAAPPAVDLKDYAANARWLKETGGMIYMGIPIATDDRAKIMISGARQAAELDENFSTPWVAADGSVTVLNAMQIKAVSDALLAHVQNVFDTFSTIVGAIDNGDITTTEQIDDVFEAV